MPSVSLAVTVSAILMVAACGRTGSEATVAEASPATAELYAAPLPGPTPATRATTKWRGATFAHEGYDGVHGYGGSKNAAALDSLIQLGVSAVSIVPYTFMQDPRKPAPLPIPDRIGGETDEAVVASIQEAHQMGLQVMLKPHIWIRGGWPGDIDFDTKEEWEAFFGHYRTWIMHYADIAAEQNVAAFCIGTELKHATLKHPLAWRSLTAEIRGVYTGTLTYAANWGEEFEELTWWEEVDVVGLDAYYPLSQSASPTEAELLSGARTWMATADAVAKRAGKPLWLTEVGYRSVERAWMNPHAEPDGRAADAVCQARCYEALAQAASESEMLTASFIWKWPSYLGHGYREARGWEEGVGDTGFHPGGKPAAQVVKDWYTNWH